MSPPTPTLNIPVTVTNQHTLPPPYEAHDSGSEHGGDEEDETSSHIPNTTIYINASTNIRGHNNIVTSPTLDTSHLAAQITAAMRGHQYQLGLDAGPLTVRIDRSVSVVGDRNAVGGGLGSTAAGIGGLGVTARGKMGQEIAKRMAVARQIAAAQLGVNAAGAGVRVTGVKRKADDGEDGDAEREAKRTAMRRAESCPPN